MQNLHMCRVVCSPAYMTIFGPPTLLRPSPLPLWLQASYYADTRADKFLSMGFPVAAVHMALAYRATNGGDDTQVGPGLGLRGVGCVAGRGTAASQESQVTRQLFCLRSFVL
jgi:hypothetical protein